MVDAEKRLEGFDPVSMMNTCRDYLAGPWASVTPETFHYKALT